MNNRNILHSNDEFIKFIRICILTEHKKNLDHMLETCDYCGKFLRNKILRPLLLKIYGLNYKGEYHGK